MPASRASSILLVAGCLAAAGVGGYVAVRRNAAADRPPAVTTMAPAGGAQPGLADRPTLVDETEAVVGEKVVGEKDVARDVSRNAAPVSLRASRTPFAAKDVETPDVEQTATRAKSAAADQVDVQSGTTLESAPRGQTAHDSPAPASDASSDSRVAALSTDTDTQPAVDVPAVGPDSIDTAPVAPAPPARTFEEFIVSADSVIGIQMDTAVSSERAALEDRVEARVTRDVKVGGRTAIPAGSRMLGSITLVERGGKVKERARLGIRFHTLVLADDTSLPVQTETVYREGDSPASESAAKIGGAAVGGAILGAIFGGTRGAVVGGSAGAAGGAAAVMGGGRNPATLPAGSTLTVRLSEPVTVTVEK